MFKIGKVRNIKTIDNNKISIITSDRQSAFNKILCEIKNKGILQTLFTKYWFEKTNHIINNHMIESYNNVLIAKKCDVIPIEFVIRNYLTGTTETSIWYNYNKGCRTFCGNILPDNLIKNQKIDIIITPTHKSDKDESTSYDEILEKNIINKSELDFIYSKCIDLFKFVSKICEEKNIILVDTKLEFGKDENNNILLIDECFTFDSSRFWYLPNYIDSFNNNYEPDSIDKDIIRKYVNSICNPYKDIIPEIPNEIKNKTFNTYLNLVNKFINVNIN
jgi:phosphoribosylaminoimidazole-succinocarboxamide synthase